LTALGQISSDSVKITRLQQKECVKWYYDNQFKDSIIVSKDSIINRQTEFIQAESKRIERLDSNISTMEESLAKMKKRRNRSIIIGGIGTIASFIVGLLLF